MRKRIQRALVTILLSAACAASCLAAERFSVVAYAPPHRLDWIPADRFALLDVFIYHGFRPDPETNGIIGNWGKNPSAWSRKANAFSEKRKEQLAAIRANNAIEIWAGFPGNISDYAPICEDPDRTAAFLGRVIDLCKAHGFSGVDFDYEFPKTAEEKESYSRFLRQAAPLLQGAGIRVSIAVHYFNFPDSEALQAIDRIHLMSYSAHTVEELARRTGFLLKAGVSREKIYPGVGFFSMRRKPEGGFESISYRDLAKQYDLEPGQNEVPGWQFSGPVALRELTRYARDADFGGIMIWEIGQDLEERPCLLDVVHEAAAKPHFPTQ